MKAFRCARTGVMYPADYVEQWGRSYGIGLGPTPVSEALVNDYDKPVVTSVDGQSMHPLSVCAAQIDCVDVPEMEYNEKKGILHIHDIGYQRRAKLMIEKQTKKSATMRTLYPTKSDDKIIS